MSKYYRLVVEFTLDEDLTPEELTDIRYALDDYADIADDSLEPILDTSHITTYSAALLEEGPHFIVEDRVGDINSKYGIYL